VGSRLFLGGGPFCGPLPEASPAYGAGEDPGRAHESRDAGESTVASEYEAEPTDHRRDRASAAAVRQRPILLPARVVERSAIDPLSEDDFTTIEKVLRALLSPLTPTTADRMAASKLVLPGLKLSLNHTTRRFATGC